jgi:hypothetical protein
MRTLTPAPWVVIKGHVYGNGGRSRVPMCGEDAQLIAAAPAMLAALQTIANIALMDNGHWAKTIEAEALAAIAQAIPAK